MARLKLVKRNDFVSDVSELVIADGDDGIRIDYNGWSPKFGNEGEERVSEVFTFSIEAVGADQMADVLQSLEAMRLKIKDFIDNVEAPYHVVLVDQVEGESGERCALVTGYSIEPGESFHNAVLNNAADNYVATFDRMPVWEAGVQGTITFTTVNCCMSTENDIRGDDLVVTVSISDEVVTMEVFEAIVWRGTIAHVPILPSTVLILILSMGPTIMLTDDVVEGHLYQGQTAVGTIDYETGVIIVNGATYQEGDLLTATYNYISTTPTYGSTFDLPCAEPGRIGRLTVSGKNRSGPVYPVVQEVWGGFRSDRFGDPDNFVFPWEAELGTLGTDASLVTDSSTSPGGGNTQKVVISFVATTLASRLKLTAYQISPDHYGDLRGTFFVMMRARCDAGVACTARVDSGLLNGGTFVPAQIGERVIVDSEAWSYYNMGLVTWPAIGRVTSDIDVMKNSCLNLYASRSAGAGTDGLHIDHFFPIPAESFFHLSGLAVAWAAGQGAALHRAELYNDWLDNVEGVQYHDNEVVQRISSGGTRAQTMRLPTHGRLVACAITDTRNLADQMTVTVDVFKRYKTLRGNT